MMTQYYKFDKEQLEKLAKNAATMSLVGRFYCGKMEEPTARWLDDGGIEVFIDHDPTDLPLPLYNPPRAKRRYVRRDRK